MDCLVTKLKASVNDESLRKLGEFRFKKREGMQETTDSTYFGIEVINSATLSILNDGCFFQAGTITPDTSAGKHKTLNSGMNYLWASLNAELSLVAKYDVTKFLCLNGAFDLSEFSYMRNLKQASISSPELKGNLASLSDLAAMEYFNMAGAKKVEGDISVFMNMPNLTSIQLTGTTLIVGDIASFGGCPRLTNLEVADTKISGSIEELVAKQIQQGRASGQITIPYAKTLVNVTFEGISLAANNNVPASAGNNSITWSADGSITWS